MKNAVQFVNTDFGIYMTDDGEVAFFKAMFGDEPMVKRETILGTRKVPQWDEQLTAFATEVMKQEFAQQRP